MLRSRRTAAPNCHKPWAASKSSFVSDCKALCESRANRGWAGCGPSSSISTARSSNSAADIRRALNRTLAAAGRPALELDAVKLLIGDGAERLVARGFAASGAALDAPGLECHYRQFLAFYGEPGAADLTRPYPGVRETLQHLAGDGLKLGLCTNKPRGATANVLQHLSLAPFFAAVATPEDVAAPKPDPAHLLAVLALLDATPAAAVMVGDSANDVAAARGAGTRVVAVSYGYPRMAPERLGADLLIDRMAELPAALERLGRGERRPPPAARLS